MLAVCLKTIFKEDTSSLLWGFVKFDTNTGNKASIAILSNVFFTFYRHRIS